MESATRMAEVPPAAATDEHALHAMSHELISPVVQKWMDAGRTDPEGFWGRAAEELPWFRKWDKVLDWTPPTFQWYVGGQTNMAYNALDYHVKRGRGGHLPSSTSTNAASAGSTPTRTCCTRSRRLRQRCGAWASTKATG